MVAVSMTLPPSSRFLPRRRAYARGIGTDPGPHTEGPAMSDKSPRQTMAKKSGKSLKEKRAIKRGKASAAETSSTEAILHTKKR